VWAIVSSSGNRYLNNSQFTKFTTAMSQLDEKYNNDEVARRGSTTVRGRRMSRIGPPPGMPGNADGIDDYSMLVQMEANNAIKYRTCSWQKVI